MEEHQPEDFSQYAAGLKKVRQRRWYLWGVAIIYLPVIWLSLAITQSDRETAKVFAVWFLVACVASVLAAFVKCPRCGKYFHVNGFIPVYVRHCVNCGLPLNADKKKPKAQ
ncbi:MAG: hypothetical protein P8X63_10255 [Desulfuromonadaceae bacterium]